VESQPSSAARRHFPFPFIRTRSIQTDGHPGVFRPHEFTLPYYIKGGTPESLKDGVYFEVLQAVRGRHFGRVSS